MGWLDDFSGGVNNFFGETTGFGGKGNPDPHNMDPEVYKELYEKALAGIDSAGNTGEMGSIRSGMEGALKDQIGQLQNNAAGRKKMFEEDMSRSFGNDMQQRARAAGGTGGMASAMMMPGGAYDSHARATARGYNDLYSQAADDLGALTGTQNTLFNQDFNKANAKAGLHMNELSMRRGYGAQALENTFNSEQAGRERRLNTAGGLLKGMGNIMGGK